MARRLVIYRLWQHGQLALAVRAYCLTGCCLLSLMAITGNTAVSQSPPVTVTNVDGQTKPAQPSAIQEPQTGAKLENQEPPDRRDDRRGGGRSDERRGGPDGRGRGRAVNRFVFEAIRRDGGPLEFLPLLMHKELRTHIGATEDLASKLDNYLTEMQVRLDDERRQAEAVATTDWPSLYKQRLDKENSAFQEFLARELTKEQLDRLVAVFVQHRHLRSLSNRMVAMDRLGMPSDAFVKLRDEINRIREETMRENNEEMRRLFTSGGRNGPDQATFQELVRKNQAKVDSRIEKIVDKQVREKLQALRGLDAPRELLDLLDAPPLGPGRPNSPPAPPPN